VDVVLGHRGNDVICGGDGRDRLLGQLGHDTLYGERGQDQLLDVGGWTGPPTAADSDLVYGGSGKDQIWTISPLSRIHGQSGADTITDTNCLGTAHLAGGAGDDTFASWQQESDQRNCSSVAAFVGDHCFGGPGEDVAIADLKDATAGIESVTRR
jgi:Ca2+-binding RTX toxin-like protein